MRGIKLQLGGRIWQDGKWWLVEVPAIDAMTQGRTRKEAVKMIGDFIETAVNRPGFKVEVLCMDGDAITVASDDIGAMVSLMLRRQREAHGLSLSDMAKRLGQKSNNAYARYEQGSSVPTVEKLAELLSAIDPKRPLQIR